MISPAHQRSLRRRLVSLSCLLSGCLALAVSARAQMGGVDSDPGSPGTGGRNIIEGRIYYPSGRNVDKRVKVRLISIRGGDFLFESGQDVSIGYRSHDGDAVQLYLEESFSFRVATPEAAVALRP